MSSNAKHLVFSLNKETWDSSKNYILLDESFIETIPVNRKSEIKYEVAPNLFKKQT